jgi:hypothetical protein
MKHPLEWFPKMDKLKDVEDGAEIVYNHTPLTKREYFAALAMQALLSDSQLNGYTPQQYAEGAVEYADALIKELNKEEDNGTD